MTCTLRQASKAGLLNIAQMLSPMTPCASLTTSQIIAAQCLHCMLVTILERHNLPCTFSTHHELQCIIVFTVIAAIAMGSMLLGMSITATSGGDEDPFDTHPHSLADVKMIAKWDTTDWPCWLTEACDILLLLQVCVALCRSPWESDRSCGHSPEVHGSFSQGSSNSGTHSLPKCDKHAPASLQDA